jgi:polyvinyl alcohol dehydrogenase (cytochrome)
MPVPVCHDGAGSLRAGRRGEAIYLALTNGVMKTQANGLSTAQILALVRYIGPTSGPTGATSFPPTCKGASAFQADTNLGKWDGWSTSVTNSRFQEAASAGLSASDLPRLKVKWAFNFSFNLGAVTVARSQRTVVDGRLFITTQTGVVFALDADNGCTRWAFKAAAGIRSGVTIGEAHGKPAAFFSDSGERLMLSMRKRAA